MSTARGFIALNPPPPTDDQYAYVSQVIRNRRQEAIRQLLTVEHLDAVTDLVFGFGEAGDVPAGQVARQIIDYLATAILEPLLVDPVLASGVDTAGGVPDEGGGS